MKTLPSTLRNVATAIGTLVAVLKLIEEAAPALNKSRLDVSTTLGTNPDLTPTLTSALRLYLLQLLRQTQLADNQKDVANQATSRGPSLKVATKQMISAIRYRNIAKASSPGIS
jgi:hypothetical protein